MALERAISKALLATSSSIKSKKEWSKNIGFIDPISFEQSSEEEITINFIFFVNSFPLISSTALFNCLEISGDGATNMQRPNGKL